MPKNLSGDLKNIFKISRHFCFLTRYIYRGAKNRSARAVQSDSEK